jgi:hypothetical protein
MANRDQYWRSRSRIGRIEAKGLVQAHLLQHKVELIKDDRHATSFYCVDCGIFGCAEAVYATPASIHGPIFEYECGFAPKPEVTDEQVEILAAIYS